MRQYIIASHGLLAEGIYNSLKFIIGEQENTKVLTAYVNGENDLAKMVKSTIQTMNINDEIIACTDVLGGSVNNEFMKYIKQTNLFLFTNMNLPLLMKLYLSPHKDIQLLVSEIVKNKEVDVKLCSSNLDNDVEVEDF